MVLNAIGMENDDTNHGISYIRLQVLSQSCHLFANTFGRKSASSLKTLFTNESADVRRGIYVFDFAD